MKAAEQVLSHARARLETAIEAGFENGLQCLPSPMMPMSEHRKAHRPGPPPKITTDPELEAFITARLERMTFLEIAAEVSTHFPESRRVGKSAIHDWYAKTKRGAKSSKR